MLTLPSSIVANINKLAISPVLFFDFIRGDDVGYHVASKVYELFSGESGSDGVVAGDNFASASATFLTWGAAYGDHMILGASGTDAYPHDELDMTEGFMDFVGSPGNGSSIDWELWFVYNDLLRKGSSLSLTTQIPYLMRGINSIGNLSVKFLDWEGTLKNDFIRDVPDLSDTDVSVRIGLATSTNTDIQDDTIEFFRGTVYDWSIRKDVMNLKIKNTDLSININLPQNLLSDSYSNLPHPIDYCKPLQYGDFNSTIDTMDWKEIEESLGGFAFCPYVESDYIDHTFWVADHKMESFPAFADWYDAGIAKFVIWRDNRWCQVQYSVGAVTNTTTDGCFVTARADPTQLSVGPFMPPTDEYSSSTDAINNVVSGFAGTIDGDSSTSCTLNVTNCNLVVHNISIQSLVDGFREAGTQGCNMVVKFGAISGTTGSAFFGIYDKGTGAKQVDLDITTGMANTNQSAGTSSLGTGGTAELNDVVFRVFCRGDWSIEVKNIVAFFATSCTTLQEHPHIYVACEGKEYDGTWDGRKTSGDLIEYPQDIIEDLLRDGMGVTGTDIDTDSFDVTGTSFENAGSLAVKVKGTIIEQKPALDYIEDISSMFGITTIKSLAGKYRSFFPEQSDLNWASGGGSITNTDIFTEAETLTGDTYTEHPIKKDSLIVKRTPQSENYKKLILNHSFIDDSYKRNDVRGSDGHTLTVNNWLVGDDSSAWFLTLWMDDNYLIQRTLVEFDAFYDALPFELGDIINIRHSALGTDFLDQAITTQKWVILKTILNWHPATIKILAGEIV